MSKKDQQYFIHTFSNDISEISLQFMTNEHIKKNSVATSTLAYKIHIFSKKCPFKFILLHTKMSNLEMYLNVSHTLSIL